MEQVDVLVVGAGWYGLVAAQTYLKLAPETNLLVVDDGETIGGIWSQERIYPSLYAQINYPLFEYSFYPMKKEGISSDGFISGQAIHNYLVSFAKDHDLMRHVRLQTRVTQVRRNANHQGWIVETQSGERPIECNKLIYATGANSSPIRPEWPRENFDKPVIHSLDMATNLSLVESDAIQRATVVGASKSSYDTVYQLLKAGKKVDWIIRPSASGAFSIFAPTFMGLWHISDHISTRFASSFSPSIMSCTGLWDSFLQRTMVGRSLTRVYWQVATGLAARYARFGDSEHTEHLRPWPHTDGLFWGSGGIGIATVPDFWQVIHDGDVTVHRTEIESLSHLDVVNLKNGFSVPTDIVIHCTGFEKGYSTFSPLLQEELGLHYDSSSFSRWTVLDAQAEQKVNAQLPILNNSPFDSLEHKKHSQGPNRHYRRLIVPELAAKGDRSILFPGHIHSAFTPLAAELQALWGFAFLNGWMEVPGQEEMEVEAATFNAWTRKRYIEQGKKHSYFIYDYISYLDTLMKDLGLNPRRKKTFFEEWFIPYRPQDYRGLIQEYLTVHSRRIPEEKETQNQEVKVVPSKKGNELSNGHRELTGDDELTRS
ncbi:cofactor FMO1 FAD enzyme [Aspergillus caelatus]|uniref:Cofactor FMO1 FAD enzyme n=2 Tax=Aspergillus subgen. Circumdati TaxID=2720871 RepID=A0A5N6ZZG3_9EURO|nr:cofactor FMO1 FAD enzyme [Aspergillus caelatus]KAE8362922.1 cofactor FMO1 FAD enzyme [Aspergillus caelatus]KAE8423265.1 cofactor FMO1 FAD enzyme [Aspergillus pseudocaelatus]